MRIAYIILTHKLPEQIVRLVCKLNTEDSSFFIHVDKKTDRQTFMRISEPLRAYKNIQFLNRLVCNYGDFNHVKATLEGIQAIVASGVQYDYVILLTGQDYPIKSNEHIRQFLEQSDGKSFIEYFTLPSEEHWKNENGGMDRLTHLYFNIFGRSHAFPKKGSSPHSIFTPMWSFLSKNLQAWRKLPLNYKLYGGSAYWCLSKDCVEYLDKFVRENAGFIRFFRNVLIPEEIFFQTVLLNSPYQTEIINDDLRYINWSGTWHPDIFRSKDFNLFIKSNHLFARKFDISIDTEVLDKIDQVTGGPSQVTSKLVPWQNR